MITEEKLLCIQQELEQSGNFNAFILKYHHIDHIEVQYLVILAYWQQIQNEQDSQHKIDLMKRFLKQHRSHKDHRIKRLLILALIFILQHSTGKIEQQENELYNEIIELSQCVDEREAEISVAVIEAYWHKAQQLDDKDSFKAEYFYHRIILLSHNLQGIQHLKYYLRAQVARILLAIQQKQDVTQRVDEIFRKFPEHADKEINQYLLTLIHTFLQHISPEHDTGLSYKIDVLEQLIETPKFTHIINASLDSEWVGGILRYLIYLFWVDQRFERADILVQQYFRNENKPLSQILENNFQFPISDDVDLEAFNQYLSGHYEQFSHLQKYRKLFKVNHKNIIFKK